LLAKWSEVTFAQPFLKPQWPALGCSDSIPISRFPWQRRLRHSLSKIAFSNLSR
jgi:hypothetical protein